MKNSTQKLFNFIKFNLCACLVVISAFVFAGCNNEKNSLNMAYYTSLTSSYSLQTSSSEIKTVSSEFLGDEIIFRQYNTITINLSSEWLYNFEVNNFSFDLTTNTDCELQFKITFTNLRNGTITDSKNVKNKQFTFLRSYKSNETKTDAIFVRDFIDLAASNTKLIFELTNTEVYYTNGELNQTAFSLNNLKLFGEHKYS